MNSKFYAYDASTLDKGKIDRYAKKMASETAHSPNWQVSCDEKTYKGWRLTTCSRSDYARSAFNAWTYYDTKDTLFLCVDGRLLVHHFYCVEKDDDRGKRVDRLEKSIRPFSDYHYLIFDFPRDKIDNDIVQDDFGVKDENPFYDKKGLGITLLIKHILS